MSHLVTLAFGGTSYMVLFCSDVAHLFMTLITFPSMSLLPDHEPPTPYDSSGTPTLGPVTAVMNPMISQSPCPSSVLPLHMTGELFKNLGSFLLVPLLNSVSETVHAY